MSAFYRRASTIFLWLRKNREFSIQYRCAKQVQIDRMLCQFGEPLMEIADNSANDIRLAKRRIAAGKLHIGRLMPKKYSLW